METIQGKEKLRSVARPDSNPAKPQNYPSKLPSTPQPQIKQIHKQLLHRPIGHQHRLIPVLELRHLNGADQRHPLLRLRRRVVLVPAVEQEDDHQVGPVAQRHHVGEHGAAQGQLQEVYHL